MYHVDNVQLAGLETRLQLDIPSGIVGCVADYGDPPIGTQLLRLLNAMDAPLAGEVRLDGQLLSETNPWALRKRVVMAPRKWVFFGQTIRENLLAGLQFHGRSCTDEEETAMMALLQLSHPRDGQAALLTAAEQQRLCVGRVLLMKPGIVLLDDALYMQTPDVLPGWAAWVQRYGGSMICTAALAETLAGCEHVITLPAPLPRERHHTAYHAEM